MAGITELCCLYKLKVHQLKVEARRVRASYTVVGEDGTEQSTELLYSYGEKYFDPSSDADLNLASMMVAQVALNYGLFFREIEFEGVFEAADRRFLTDMMENTSREVLVMKFLSENVFLKKEYQGMQAEKRERYTAATLSFTGPSFKSSPAINKDIREDAYAILSSGGKDSLLTYGLVKEIGEAHPVFINESGRHWYSAVNAYKYFKDIEPNTVKPWCNSDRVFNWMLRQLPFIREDFQNVRADIYPIRMWTVAVFLFGVLPVVRKRGLGNVLIGNEYDTTQKGNHKGITHYHGLYDQSLYFDNALTRYYRAKGWRLYQFSMLRSLSELLILKILVKRYPELQRRQVSCHAAHEHLGVMLPCGKCEKCRRIVGMLSALDEDPARCGYSEAQVRECLHALATRSVKQIGPDAAQLYHLLLEKGLVERSKETLKRARNHPEIMGLRFDKERSRMEDLPMHVRKPLFAILSDKQEIYFLKDRTWSLGKITEDTYLTPYFLKGNNEN